MLLHIPTRFLDRRSITPIAELRPGVDVTIGGTVTSVSKRYRGKGPSITAVLSDGSGAVTLTFFRAGFPGSKLRQGTKVVACGIVESFRGYTIVHPDLYFSGEAAAAVEAPGMLAVYGLTAGITQAAMRRLVISALETVKGSLVDILPPDLIRERGFSGRWAVFNSAHRPDSPEQSKAARDLLALEELFLHRSVLAAVREKGNLFRSIPLSSIDPEGFEKTLPWRLTQAQKRVCREVSRDMSGSRPMRRLIQGDVGSGKTVVAAFACVVTALSGKTAAVLAPTEVLAAQHYRSIGKFCRRFDVAIHLLTGGSTAVERKKIAEELLENPPAILVGTHAILESWVPLDQLALLVTDEQHRFGVAQREKLLSGRDPRPHSIVMSATPIPRTLAMTFYGDLDVSLIDQMPPGRGSTKTTVVKSSEKSGVFSFMVDRLRLGERIFLVYPLKEASEQSDLRDARTAYEIVCKGPMADFGVGLLLGSMTQAEKLSVANQFTTGEVSVLVSTTVVEVGIDVPQATVMAVVNAERFGLSQLHQLRGRVGRGKANSWCFLVPGERASLSAMERLRLLESISDGFVIAEKDLSLRGPGQVLGTAQHGIPRFRVADLVQDRHLLLDVNNMPPIGLRSIGPLLRSQSWRYTHIELPPV